MAERRGRGQGFRPTHRPTPRQNRQQQSENQFANWFFGDDEPEVVTGYLPTTNRTLRDSSPYLTDPYRGNLGMTADHIEISPEQVEIDIDPNDEVVRQPKIEAETLTGRDELQASTVAAEVNKGTLELDGTFSPEIVSIPVIDLGKDAKGNDRGQVAGGFRRSNLESIKGDSGPAALLSDLPGRSINRQINEECLMFGRRGKEEVIVAVATGDETEETQKLRINQVRRRLHERLQREIQQAFATGNAEQAKLLSERAADLMKHRDIVFLKPGETPKEAKSAMQSIVTKLNGTREKIDGFTHLNIRERTLTIAQPVYLKPQSKGIDPDSIRTVDGTGNGREFRWMSGDNRTASAQMRQVLRHLRGESTVQHKPGGELQLGPSKAARLLLNPYATPPSVN